MKKTVGILTFYFADNYGAFLQCYALQSYCELKGINARVIKFIPRKMIPIRSRIKKIFFKTSIQKKFDECRYEFLKIDSGKNGFDKIIVGSDQVWNPEINFKDNRWVDPLIQRSDIYAYAASCGKKDFSSKYMDFFKHNKHNFLSYKKITVREKFGQELLEEIGIKSEVVCDPVMLFIDSINIFDCIYNRSRMKINYKFILVYSLEYSAEIDRISSELKQTYGYKIISIHSMNNNIQQCDCFIKDADPSDFLWLIRNCEIAVTNSFHGLAFSFLYKKKVFCALHKTLGSRQLELIEASGMNYTVDKNKNYYINTDQNYDSLISISKKSQEVLSKMIS